MQQCLWPIYFPSTGGESGPQLSHGCQLQRMPWSRCQWTAGPITNLGMAGCGALAPSPSREMRCGPMPAQQPRWQRHHRERHPRPPVPASLQIHPMWSASSFLQRGLGRHSCERGSPMRCKQRVSLQLRPIGREWGVLEAQTTCCHVVAVCGCRHVRSPADVWQPV